jgi:hypothetical protein
MLSLFFLSASPHTPRSRPAHTRRLVACAGLILLFGFTSCGWWRRSHAPPTELIVGVQSEPMGGIISALHIVIHVGGAVVDDEVVKPPTSSLVGFPQPWEKKLVATDLAAEVDVDVDAVGPSGAAHGPHLTRHASTHFQPGKTSLLRVGLESRCVVYPPPPKGRGTVPGPLSGPACTAPSTCIRGLCQSGAVPPTRLEAFTKDWPNNAPDLCKPRNAGPPTLALGTGQTGYTPLAAGQTLQAEAGPQGGHHIWIAVRMKNMKQVGSTTRLSAVQPDTGKVIPSSTFAFTFEKDEGGYCKLYGLRYQLDNGGIDYTQFLGKPLDVTATVLDSAQGTSSSTVRIQVAPTLLNP